MSLQGKVAIVTGGSRGIGAASAQALAARGAKIVVSYLNQSERAEQLLGQIRAIGGDGIAVQADARNTAQTQRLVDAAVKQYGRVDIVVSNAPVGWVGKPFRTLAWEEYCQVVEAELKAAFDLTQAVLPMMTAQHSGRLIYIASGLYKQPIVGRVASGTAKGALVTLVRYLAQELGPDGITANAVAPGLVETEIDQDMPEQERQMVAARTPLRRVGQPDDVAGVVAFLAGDEGKFVTGACIHVSGGMMMD